MQTVGLFRYFIIFCFLCISKSYAQKLDSIGGTISLQQVTVSENVLANKLAGITVQRIDSLTQAQLASGTLADLLAFSTPIYVKSYGPSGTATLSFRGTSANHTGIYWNNIPLNSPTLGLSNLTLLPTAFSQTIDIQHGGASALLGSGNIGGSIHLSTCPTFKKTISIDLMEEAGSFYNYASDVNIQLGTEKWYVSSMAQYHQIENNFPYVNTADIDRPLLYQTNADMQQYGFMQAIYYKITDNQYLGSRIWYQHTQGGLPTLMTAVENYARQKDESLRTMLEWKKYAGMATYHLEAAFTNDISTYTDSTIQLISAVRSQLYFFKAVSTFHIGKRHKLNTGIDVIVNRADAQYYEQIQQREQLALYASYLHYFSKIDWKVSINLRQEVIRKYNVPLTPSVGLEGKIWKYLYTQASLSRNYRLPTLNDLYWFPGGNLTLLPESGWSKEVGLVIKNNESAKILTTTSIVYYSAIVDNWIQWIPAENNSYWEAQNVKMVWARGVEITSRNGFQLNKMKVEFNMAYTYSKSTNHSTLIQNDQTLYKQLVYVPLHNANAELRVLYKGSFISYHQRFIGERYTTTDNLRSLPSYLVGDVAIGSRCALKHIVLSALFKINNCWNTSYQAIEWMAMPGRNYQIILKINFHTIH